MEQLSPNHKRSLSDNPLYASSEDMEMEPLSRNYKRVLTRNPSDVGYRQFTEEVVDTSEIKSHSQEISSQTGFGPEMDRYLSDDLENNKDLLERSYPKDVRSQPNSLVEDDVRSQPNSLVEDDVRYQPNSLVEDYVPYTLQRKCSTQRVTRTGRPTSYYNEPRPVSPPLRRRFQRAPSITDIGPRGPSSWLASEDGIEPTSFLDHRPEDFENDNNANPADSASQKPHSPKTEHLKKPNEETSTKKNDNHAISAQIDEANYTRASNVPVSNFVSVKLCGKSNYHMWKTQMECLMRSHNMLGLVDDKRDLPVINKNPELTKRYENLLNGWLIGSLNEEIIKDDRIYDQGAKGIWSTLGKSYDPLTGSPTDLIFLNKSKEVERRGADGNAKLKNKLHNSTLEGHWWKAKSIIENNVDAARWAINDNGDTLLHLAVKEGNNYFIKMLMDIVDFGKKVEIKNSEGHTALHIAAIVGNKDAAELFVEKGKELLLIKDKDSKIPLACAYLNKQVNAFVYLWEVTEQSIDESSRPDKEDLRKEIYGSLKDSEKEIDASLNDKYKGKEIEKDKPKHKEKEKEKEIDEHKPKEKETKKEIGAILEDLKKEIGESLLHTAIFNKEYDLSKELVKINAVLANKPTTLEVLTRNFPSQIGFTETLMYPSLNNVCQRLSKRSSLLFHSLEYLYARAGGTFWKMRSFKKKNYCSLFPELVISLLVPAAVLYPIYQLLCLFTLLLIFPFSMLYFILWKALAFFVVPIKNIEKKIKEHKEAKKFLKFICDSNSSWEANSSKHFEKFYKESLMEAVRLDVYEVLDQILKLSSDAMKVENKDGHNIIQLAVINRSQKVYNLISPIIEGKGSYRRVKDVFSNNLLHLAGRLAPSVVLSLTTGAALQLQRELQWREEVKKLMEPTQHTDLNVDYETPEIVFSREHANLVKEGEKWMKTTAESCSITAALIITIVFAAAITVPGGSNQETGIPLFKKDIAFNIFAVADAISLFSASTSLLVFLSILTTRFAEKDFLISLPRRLFVGLCLLFLSTTAMMLAFSTILFLVFCDKRPWMLAPIGGLTCFPIAAIVTLQLPLVIDLYQATYIPIFGKEKKVEKVQKLREADDKKVKRKFRNILRVY